MADLDQAQVRPTTEAPAPQVGHRERLRRHLSQPFFRNAYSLVLNTGVTGALGLAFWLIAARTYDEADVGRGSVSISVMSLLAGVVALNLTGTLTRFIGTTGRRTGRFVLSAYLLTVVAVSLLAVAFLLTLGLWGSSFVHLSGFSTGLLFVGAVVGAAVFTLQDGVLMGLRRSGWVLIENAVFSVAKIGLLVYFATADPRDGVYLSWIIAMAAVLVPVNVLIFGVFLPRHQRAAPAGQVPPARTQIRRFFAADYVGAVCLFAIVQVVPFMVATDVPLYAFGYFYIAWTIGSVLNLVASNMATSLTVEAAYDVRSISANCRAAISRTMGLLLVAAVTLALVAPYGLELLGRGYLDAASLLQLLAVAALPTALTEIYLGVLRAQNDTRGITRLQIVRGVLVLGLVFVSLRLDAFLADIGMLQLTAVGVAVLLSQTLVAAWVLPRLRSIVAAGAPSQASILTPVTHAVATGADESAVQPARATTVTVAPPEPRPAEARPLGRRIGRLVPAGLGLLALAAVLLVLTPLRSIDLEELTGLGLISVLPVASLLGLVLLAVVFLAALAMPRAHRLLLGSLVVVTVVCLHGLPVMVESMPRFPTAWVHIGFIEFINRTGVSGTGLDGRFSWPGFFSLSAFLTDGREWQDLDWVIRLAPLVSNLLYLLPFALFLSNMCASWRARWLAVWLFAVLNWVGQDYWSPQGLTYLFYLVLLAVLVTWFRPAGPAGTRTWRPRLPGLARLGAAFGALRQGELPPRPIGFRERAILLALLVALFGITTGSHQLTPYVMISACLGLVLIGRCVLRGMPALMVVVALAWVSFMADAYWSGHLSELLGGVGAIATNVSASVAGRAYTSGPEHLQVLHTRVGLAVAVGILAGLGALRRWWKGFDDRIALLLMVTPGIALALQSYGGEIALRVYMFALPAACLLIAYAVFPDFPGVRLRPRHAIALVTAALCVPLLLLGFLVARFGNEAFEYVRPGEVAALDQVYEDTSGPVHVHWLTSQPANLPNASTVTGYRDMDRVFFAPVKAPRTPEDTASVVEDLASRGPDAYLLTTRSQEAELVEAEGYRDGWGDRFRARMAATPGIRVVVANDDAVVYAALAPDTSVEPADMPSVSAGGGVSPLTPVGAVCFLTVLGLLLSREFRRLRGLHGEPRDLRMLTLAALPLFIGFLVVVIERFAVLA